MTLRIGTAEAGGTFHSQGEAIAELFNRHRSRTEKCIVETSRASIDNARRLDRSELEFGFMASNWIGRAREGQPPFAGRIALRVVAPANVGPIFFVTPARSPVATIGDLRGRRVVLGAEGSGMVEHARTILGLLGIPFGAFTPVYMGYPEAGAALIAGEVDVLFQPPIPNRWMTELSERTAVRVVPYAPGQIEKILSHVSYYRPVTIQAGAFRGALEPVPQIGVLNVIVTHERVPEPMVYDLARTIAENLQALGRTNALFEGLEEIFVSCRAGGATAFEFGGVPLHPGAARAYRELGWLRA
ncbi:MAG TPA: TAXI family TRAP transporter solute-binding subunit [Candidatus Eisenbacteria bacterium]|nr:TAXI family TRAP transporter solute-binding subunit [Candidatus Eisenbacteria bacterium]